MAQPSAEKAHLAEEARASHTEPADRRRVVTRKKRGAARGREAHEGVDARMDARMERWREQAGRESKEKELRRGWRL